MCRRVVRGAVLATIALLAVLACRSKPDAETDAAAVEVVPSPPAAQEPVPRAEPVAAPAQPAAPEEHADEEGKDEDEKKDEKPRRGLPVTEPLIVKHCGTCHQDQGGGLLGRMSYMRKTPEGWELSLKRMIRLERLTITPEDAKQIVRYLANDHGLARDEAKRAMYETERRVHWSEQSEDKALRETCAECHTLGRIYSERRDEQEWKYLKATHLAYYPLARWQAFRSDSDDEVDWNSLSEAEADERWEEMNRATKRDRADEVLEKLAQQLPLFTPEWESWQVNRREVPLAGAWDVVGHEPSRGDVRGTLRVTRTDVDTYDTAWELQYERGGRVERTGKALLYSGYSWRGRSTAKAEGEAPELREVLLLADDWNTFEGRIFTGEYNEIGADVRLRRRVGAVEIHSVDDGAVMIPSTGHELVIAGQGFPDDLEAADFHLGDGVSITKAERVDATRVKLTVDAARKAKRGLREVSFRAVRGPASVVLYDTVDYVKAVPEQGLARVGGKLRPPQLERFEAVAMNRGIDDELYTEDDYLIEIVPATWAVAEFPVRENDDDAQFVGSLDAATGVFTPALDGPNPARRWSANNIGEVFVVAKSKLRVQELPPKPKQKPGEKPAPERAIPPDTPVVMVDKEFTARGHLLVMVPLYVQWDRYAWDKR